MSVPDVHTSGKILAAIVPLRRPATSSSSVSVPASKNFSISFSSFSATISTSASRAASTAAVMSAGTGPSVNAPLSSVLNVNAFRVTRSTMPLKLFSAPIGSWIGMMVRVNVSRSDASDRSRLARSRSIRLRTTIRGSDSSSAASHAFSVWTIGPATASTTTSAPSATWSAARASARKFPMPGVSIRLIFCLFHSAYATLEDSVCLRAISSSSKSVTVVPSSTLPNRLTIPATERSAEASCVLPEPL